MYNKIVFSFHLFPRLRIELVKPSNDNLIWNWKGMIGMRQITTLSNGWLFTQMAQEAPPALLPQDWEEVTLPHTWNNLDGQDGGSDYYRGACWYCRALSIPVPADGGRIYLEFQGAAFCPLRYTSQMLFAP